MSGLARAVPPEPNRGEPWLARFAGGLVEAAVLVALVGAPLFVDGANARRFEPLKVALVRSAVLVALWALAVRAVERRRARAPALRAGPWSAIRRTLADPLAAAIVLVACAWTASTALALAPRLSTWGSFARLQGLYSLLSYAALAACVASCLGTRERIERLVDAMIVTSIPIAALGVLQRYGLDPLGLMQDPRRVGSTLGAPSFAGAYVAMVLPLTLARLVESVAGAWREAGASKRFDPLPGIYGFALALQALFAVFTQSRGPMLGMLGACFVLGLCALLHVARQPSNRAGFSGRDLARACGAAAIVGAISLAGGGLGALIGGWLERVLDARGRPLAEISTLGLGAGAALGFASAFAFLLRDEARRRRAWITWLALGVGVLLGVFALNLRGTALDGVLDPLRRVPFLGRLARMGQTEGGSVQVRLLIWRASLELVGAREPIGVPGSERAPLDPRDVLRPWLGYGLDSSLLTFPSVEPPELAYVEARGSVADRAHNETIDALVMTGRAGTIATYLLWLALSFRSLALLGFVPDRAARGRLWVATLAVACLFASVAYFVGRGWTLVPLGFALGLFGGLIVHLACEGWRGSGWDAARTSPMLEIGLFAVVCGYWIQVHFLFPTSPVYVHFWVCVGALLALSAGTRAADDARSAGDGQRAAAASGSITAMIVSLVGFASLRAPSGALDHGRPALVLVLGLTIAAGLGIASSRTRGVLPHVLWALSGLAILLAPRAPDLPARASTAEAFHEAGVLWRGYASLLGLLLALALAMAAFSSRGGRARGPDLRRLALHAPLGIALALLLWFENVRVARAGLDLEVGNRRALEGNWEAALALHERARALDRDEARYSLAIAQDCQGMALDSSTFASARAQVWSRGETAALEAQRIAPYDVDNTANLGRFESSRAQAGEPERFARALAHFDEALALAPRDVELHRSAAQAALASGDARAAVERLERSLLVDPGYAATWILLGDARLALNEAPEALLAHRSALERVERGNDGLAAFADGALDERLRAYRDAGSLGALVAALEELAELHRRANRLEAAARFDELVAAIRSAGD